MIGQSSSEATDRMINERQYQLTAIVVLCIATVLIVGAGAVASQSPDTGGVTAVQENDTQDEETAPVSVQNLTAPEEVQIGENFTVSANVTNDGDEVVVQQVTYRIEGSVIDSEFVQVPEGNTTTITFNVTGDDTSGFPTGTFTHGVFIDDAEATANVTLTAPEETPEETTPEETTPEETTPEEETPEETTPVETTPEETMPEETTPEETTPVETTPVETTPEETTPVETTPEETTPEEPRAASVTFESQRSNGTAVVVDSVTVPESGFVVVHDTGIIQGEVAESVLGTSEFLESGTHQNVTVELDEQLTESQRLVVVTYRDSNENQEFDFLTSNQTVDGPYRLPDERQAVNDIANVTVENDEEQ